MNFENPGKPENNFEGEGESQEVKEQAEALNKTAEEVAQRLESTDPSDLGETEKEQISSKIKMVLGALIMIGAYVGQGYGGGGHGIENLQAVDFEAGAVAAGGALMALEGVMSYARLKRASQRFMSG